jgi:hypothetical protein
VDDRTEDPVLRSTEITDSSLIAPDADMLVYAASTLLQLLSVHVSSC